jgi:hypothetical protein
MLIVKMVIKFSGLVLALAVVLAGRPARAEAVFFTTRSVLTELFPKSERVSYQVFTLDAAAKARITRRLGYAPPKDRYTVFIATSHGKVDGYALIDDEKGLHQPITFATRLSPRGAIDRLEIMVYREPRGDEVRDPRFRKQFQGKTSHDAFRLNEDVDAVSGATVSSASLAVGARRATILLEEVGLVPAAVAAAASPREARPGVPGSAPVTTP